MVRSLSLGVILLAAVQAMAQDTPADTSGFNERNGMQAPPPVSGQAFSTQVGSEVRMNYLSMGLGTVIAYDNNLVAGYGSKPLSEWSYTVWPTITVDKNTRRALALVTYTPGFTFYEPTSSFNESDQNLSGKLSRSNGVLCPPNVDPGMTAPTPNKGTMPVIPPPGSSPGQSVQPK